MTDYSAIVVTFRRPESLDLVLHSLESQSCSPSLVVVADNDSMESARPVVLRANDRSAARVVYLPMGENLGPAGGWAAAASLASLETDRGEWLLVVDDDDPLSDADIIADLLGAASAASSEVACIGPTGAVLNGRAAKLRKVRPTQGMTVDVDYLPSGISPLYSWACIDSVGFFREDLFFGFEDLEFGLRLKRFGWRLIVVSRSKSSRLRQEAPIPPATRNPPLFPWREYYKTRALIWILKEYAGVVAGLVAVVRSIGGGFAKAIVRERSADVAISRVVGAWDGWQGNLGRKRYNPDINPAKTKKLPG